MSKSKRNGSEAKFYPNSSTSLASALLLAKTANDQMGANTILSADTVARLNNIQPLHHQARVQVAGKKAAYIGVTRQKEEGRNDAAMFASHFMQVFNMGAKRKKYAFGDRALFGMDTNSEALPLLKTDAQIETAALNVVEGEALRIAAGKTAVENPSGAEVEAKLNHFQMLIAQTSNANDAYGDAQKALRTLDKEGRSLIKKIWREVETYYGEGTRERMRKWARHWGVVYARKGAEKLVSGTVTDAATGLPVAAVKLKFENGNNKALSNSQGKFSFNTNLLHAQTLIATRSGHEQAEIMIELKEGEENICVVKMSKAVMN